VQKGSACNADGPEEKSPYSGRFISQVVGLLIDAISTVDSGHDTKIGTDHRSKSQVLVCVDAGRCMS